ncbi:hypothetical protein Pla52o_51650 [Novipirellula galeiformis]|uniref:Uncharacterized protein n=1 Tax=Novipirellula galeiformis TaxID=2528004 RepID=A0A5C6C153_9BACT|nr:hypothetical protein Pla52o_51650 [Novipirellula galeiformis]
MWGTPCWRCLDGRSICYVLVRTVLVRTVLVQIVSMRVEVRCWIGGTVFLRIRTSLLLFPS